MKLTFLGTSAANAFPEAFCDCPNCRQARRLGGKSLRKRSSALVNTDLLIDLGPDIHTAAQMHGISLQNVRFCLQTHPHADHFDPSHLLSRSEAYGAQGAPRLHLYASRQTLLQAALTFERDLDERSLLNPETQQDLNLSLQTLQPLQPVLVGAYRITAFPANHSPSPGALLYAVESGGKCLFYGTDTAALPEETWDAFVRLGLRFDLVVLDHTYGPDQTGSDHLCAVEVGAYAARLRREGLLLPNGRVFATHIAHEGNPAHPDLESYARQHGYEVAWDGLVLEV